MTFTRGDLLSRGVSERRWRQLVQCGDIVRVTRSQYVAAAPALQGFLASARVIDPAQEYTARAIAAQRQIKAPTLAGELTAAQIHRLSLPFPMDDRVTLIAQPTTAKPRSYPAIRVLLRDVPDAQRAECSGVKLTSVALTVVDVSRRHRLRDALVVGDSALRAGLDSDELHTALAGQAGIPYVQRARDAVALMNGVRESPLESESYAFFVERELPLPECQIWIDSDRVDFLWRDCRVVGEADGRVKYLADLGLDRGAGDALWLEKGRENRIEDLGFRFVRWTYADLRRRPDELERRIRRELGQ